MKARIPQIQKTRLPLKMARFLSFLPLMAVLTAAIQPLKPVKAQEQPVIFQPRYPIPNQMNREFFRNSESMIDQSDAARAVPTIFGFPEFPENAIRKDDRAVNQLYNTLLQLQLSGEPIIRTADLPNPFTSSVQTLPANQLPGTIGGEFIFERPPEPVAPVAPVAPPPPPAPDPGATTPRPPVEARY
jgi:hypothetical protein